MNRNWTPIFDYYLLKIFLCMIFISNKLLLPTEDIFVYDFYLKILLYSLISIERLTLGI